MGTARRHLVSDGPFVAYCLALGYELLNPNVGVPTKGIGWIADAADALGAPGWLLEPTRFEFLCNALIFVPVPVLGALAWRTVPALGWLGIGFLASVSIEVFQLLLLPERSATVIDVVSNTTGTAVGAAVVALLSRRRTAAGTPLTPPARRVPNSGPLR